jgi:hypothetical protein
MSENPILEGKKKIQTRTSIISLSSDSIIKILFIKNSVISPETLMENQRAYTAMADGKQYPFLFDVEDNVEFTPEAREFARTLSPTNILAVGVIVRNFAYRLIAEFYYRIHKPSIPYKVFSSPEEAIDWLKLYS